MNTPTQPSLKEWMKKAIKYMVEVYYSPSNEYTKKDFEKDIHQVILEAKLQGAEEERKSCLKAFKADKYKKSDVKKTTKEIKTNKEFLRGYLCAQNDLQESKTQYLVSLGEYEEEGLKEKLHLNSIHSHKP